MFSKYFDLRSLNGSNGFKISNSRNVQRYYNMGSYVSAITDMNGDGLGDIAVGDGSYDACQGAIYILYGNKTRFASSIDVKDLNGRNGMTIISSENRCQFGSAIASTDINGDGLSDVAIGFYVAAPHNKLQAGQAYVVFGQKKSKEIFNVKNLNGKNGFTIDGILSNGLLGISASGIDDINADGLQDLLLGGEGIAYVVMGSKQSFGHSFNLKDLDGRNGFNITGIPEDGLGISVNGKFDINGDGYADIALGAPGGTSAESVGKVYIIFGQKSFNSTFNLSGLDGKNGFTVKGLSTNYTVGYSVSGITDMNGDGLDELALGSGDLKGQTGQAYVIFGSKSFLPYFNLNSLDGTNGFKVDTSYGNLVSSAADINNDGFGDLLLSGFAAEHKDLQGVGQTCVLFGSDKGFNSTFDLNSLDGKNGFIIDGLNEYSLLGATTSSGKDINGNGRSSLIVGASGEKPCGQHAYVIFGESVSEDNVLEL